MPNTFNFDDYLAKQGSADSPQNVAPQNPAQGAGMQPTKAGFNFDSYLANEPSAKAGAESLAQSPSQDTTGNYGPITDQGIAFAKGVQNAMVPSSLFEGIASKTAGPQGADFLKQADANLEAKANAYPLTKLAGTGTGLVLGGALGQGVSEVAADAAMPAIQKGLSSLMASQVSEGAARGFGELALLTSEGGMFSVLNDNPNSFQDAAASFSKGASIAGALGLAVKGAGAFGDVLAAGSKSKALKQLNLAEQSAEIQTNALSRAKDLASQKAAELELTKSQLYRSQGLLTAEPAINERVSTLPNKINDLLDRHINDIHGQVLQKVDRYKNQAINPLPNFQSAVDKLEGAKVYTPEAKGTRDSALQFVRGLLDEAYVPGSVETDKLAGIYQSPKATVDRLYSQNSRFGDLLYNRDFMKNAPSEVTSALRSLQKANRDLIAGVDPTGELSQHLDFEHSLLNAKERDGFVQDAPDFFKSYAANKDDPSIMAKWRKFERNLMPRDEVMNSFGKNEAFDAGFKPETMQNADLKQRAESIRALINAEVDPATMDYATLKKVKSDIPKLQSKVSTLETQAERAAYTTDTRDLAKQKSLFSLSQAKANVPTSNIEAFMPSKLRIALHLRDNLNEGIGIMKQSQDSMLNNPIFNGGLQVLKKGAVGAARGSVTRVPSLMGLTSSPPPQMEP